MSQVFPFQPDWSSEITETEERPCDVLQAWDGTEQRMSLRPTPIRGLEFDIVVHSMAEMACLQHLMTSPKSTVWDVPWWPDASRLAAELSSGALIVPVPTSGKAYTAGGKMVFIDAQGGVTAKSIQTVGLDSVTLTSATSQTFAAGTTLAPVWSGHIVEALTLDQMTDSVAGMKVRFDCREGE